MDGSDKRVSPRFSFAAPVMYGPPEVPNNGSLAGNISLSGISLRVQQFIPVGTVLEMQIRLEDSGKVVWVRAKVVRIREVLSDDCFEIGLKFVRDEECMRTIGAYINTRRSHQQRS
jgi:hypothetical protein